VQLAEYYGYTRDEILREWKKGFTDTKDSEREFHLNEVGRLMRSMAEVRDIQEVLEKEILTPLVQKNKLFRRAADIIMKVSESQSTQKTLHEEFEELIKQAEKTNSAKSLDELEKEATTLIEILRKEITNSQGLTNQINSINIPLIVDAVSNEVNSIS
jgi:uracil phosphoribosyltransferase